MAKKVKVVDPYGGHRDQFGNYYGVEHCETGQLAAAILRQRIAVERRLGYGLPPEEHNFEEYTADTGETYARCTKCYARRQIAQ